MSSYWPLCHFFSAALWDLPFPLSRHLWSPPKSSVNTPCIVKHFPFQLQKLRVTPQGIWSRHSMILEKPRATSTKHLNYLWSFPSFLAAVIWHCAWCLCSDPLWHRIGPIYCQLRETTSSEASKSVGKDLVEGRDWWVRVWKLMRLLCEARPLEKTGSDCWRNVADSSL